MVNTGKGEAHGDAGGRRIGGAIREAPVLISDDLCRMSQAVGSGYRYDDNSALRNLEI